MGTHVLDLELQLLLGPLASSLSTERLPVSLLRSPWRAPSSISLGSGRSHFEGQVFKEVGGAVGLGGLCAGAGVDPHADRRGLRIGGVLGSDLGRCDISIEARRDFN